MDKTTGQDGKKTFSMSSLEEEQLCPDDPTLPGYVQQGHHWETRSDVREGQAAMNRLEETIARAIDPEAWEPVPHGMGSTTVGIEQQYADQREARKAAGRVIDALQLTDHVTYRFHGPVRYVYGQIDPQEDA